MTCDDCNNRQERQNYKTPGIEDSKSFSPWVFVTYDCTCKCQYCMIPEIDCIEKTMSKEAFKKMCQITERLFEKDIYKHAHFRLSGGEPLLAFDNYKDIVTEYRKKYPKQINFGLLTNLTVFNDEIADWIEENGIGIQISIDDLINGKSLQNGQSSSETVLANIQKVQMRNIAFSYNTVLDIDKTKDLSMLANFVSSFKNIEWGLNASYTEDDPDKIKEVISIFDNCISQLVKRGFDINRNLRFYNTVVGTGRGGCSAGVNSFGIGTNLEIWSCQSLANRNPIGYFDETIKSTLMNASENEYFRNQKLMSGCNDCSVMSVCKGGCRATHESDQINGVVCQIRRNILEKLSTGYYFKKYNRHCPQSDNFHGKSTIGINAMIHDFLDDSGEKIFVETPDIGMNISVDCEREEKNG